eukprot:GHVR01040944.1.p2 GENE.GHVR01040944.1~~GHVR01040944.1.p2  ORF type:complete len:124 (+),score=13.54 GHVR01040944.1:263-634(+)
MEGALAAFERTRERGRSRSFCNCFARIYTIDTYTHFTTAPLRPAHVFHVFLPLLVPSTREDDLATSPPPYSPPLGRPSERRGLDVGRTREQRRSVQYVASFEEGRPWRTVLCAAPSVESGSWP